ncbi:hypothetical protein ABIB82_003920 [Bradyrhizobium sp. i1.8.4]|uniref:hypothetical protein n=1 Tax=unclassified Bradyrhizobium TaxID=2631580 RepID=UPI003D1A87FA
MKHDDLLYATFQPDWDKATKIHDWRNHVPDKIKQTWATFTVEQRMALVEWAQHLANIEQKPDG